MPASSDLAPFLHQIDHHAIWLPLLHVAYLILKPIYRLYVRVFEEIEVPIAQGLSAEIARWFASRGQQARTQAPRADQTSDHNLGDTSPPTT